MKLFAAAAAALLAQPAIAQDQSPLLGPFMVRLGHTITWDANLFRQPDGVTDPQAARGLDGRSDRFTSTNIGLSFDKSYSQQRFQFEITETAYRYDKFAFLDRDAFNYGGAWLWRLTPRISGTLRADHSQSVVGFDDTQALRLNETVNNNRSLTIDGWLFGGWHVLAGASQSERKNSQVFLAVPNSNQTNKELGLRYVAASQSSITATRRSSRGVYPGQEGNLENLIDTGFNVRETELNATWIASGNSTFDGRLTRTERHYDRFTRLDFSGVGGEVAYIWRPTARLTVNASALRALTPFFQVADSGSAHRVDNTLAFAPAWQVSEKVSLNLRASRLVSDFPAVAGSVAGSSRRDTVRRLSFGAAWAVHQKVNLGATLQRERRTSSEARFDFDDTIAALSAQLWF